MEKLRLGLWLKLRARLLKLLIANSCFKKLSLHFLRKCQGKNFSVFVSKNICVQYFGEGISAEAEVGLGCTFVKLFSQAMHAHCW